MRSVGSSVRRVGKLPNRKALVFVTLLGLVWVAPALSRAGSTALSAHEQTAYENEWHNEWYENEWDAPTPKYSQAGQAGIDSNEVESWSEPVSESVEDLGSSVLPESVSPEPTFTESTFTEYDEPIAQLDDENYEDFATDSANEVPSLENSRNNTAPPPEPTEWISAWVDDLKQSSERWIEVDLSNQQILAWEGNTVVFSAPVSTGREGDWTPPGVYAIETKYDKAWMQGEDYDIPNVPYVMYFFGSYAIHGAYWRDNFGTPASRGCVSMSVDQAEWLYSWAAEGTHVVIER